jgi:hypothetical protein
MKLNSQTLESGQASRFVRCYDNGGKTVDRYTVVFTGRYRRKTGGSFWYVGMSAAPFHPQGFGQHGESAQQIDVNKWGFAPAVGRSNHLGKRIPFAALPDDCRKLVVRDLVELWN